MTDQSDWKLNPDPFRITSCFGPTEVDLRICISSDRTVPNLLARSTYRCLPVGLVSDTGLSQECDRTGPIPGLSTASVHCSSGTSVEATTTVPTSSAHAHCTSLSDQIMLNRNP